MNRNRSNPCIIGVGTHTWRGGDAPEPLLMWEHVVRAAAADAATGNERRVLDAVDSLDVVITQTWQYDDPPGRLCERLAVTPRHAAYSGIGGTTPQQLVNRAAEAIVAGQLDVAVITSAEALATRRAYRKAGERPNYSFAPDKVPSPPWEAPFHPSELAHEVFDAPLAFALFDNARRARLGTPLDRYRHEIAEMMSGLCAVAARNPDSWFPTLRNADDIEHLDADNRMIAYPYTKYMVAVMDVDMAAAVIVASDTAADRLGVPADQRVYLRGWCYATDPFYVAEHDDLSRSPAMVAASQEALRCAGVHTDDIAHFDLYSCFGASLNFACDALGLTPRDTRPLTVTGGLPYHGGPGSGYMTHAIAEMARRLRADPGALGMTSGVGMMNTKHVFAVYSTTPSEAGAAPPEAHAVQQAVTAAHPAQAIADEFSGTATVLGYSVAHDRSGTASSALLVCDTGDGRRAYARADDPELLTGAEQTEFVGTQVLLTAETATGPMGEVRRNRVVDRLDSPPTH